MKLTTTVTGDMTSRKVKINNLSIKLVDLGNDIWKSTDEIDVVDGSPVEFRCKGANGSDWTIEIKREGIKEPLYSDSGTIEDSYVIKPGNIKIK
ncbi:MAG TPA: hypothetical protein VIL99_16220 [Ignavibacteria bacterium]